MKWTKTAFYYRTPEQLELFRDPDWVQNVFGRQYFFNAFPSLRGVDENGNMFFPDTQPHLIYSDSTDSEKGKSWMHTV